MAGAPAYPALNSENTCDDINRCRTLFHIIWSSLTTIFLCTWVSLHLNVPPPRQGFQARVWRKLRMMLFALIAPEVMLGFAARQYFIASRFTTREYCVSPTHAFFIVMGGFVTREGHHPIVTKTQLPRYSKAIKAIPEADIKDKSKSDTLAKSLTLAKVVLFALQYVARLTKSLPISALETATVAFAGIHIITWWFWREKPRDVSEAILIEVTEREQMEAEALRRLAVGDHLNAILFGDYREYDPTSSTSVPSFWSAAYAEGLPKIALFFQLLFAILFGAVHCLAWNSSFPSAIEMWIWRACASLITGLPLLSFLLMQVQKKFPRGSAPRTVLTLINWALMALYPSARVTLLILTFTTLRDLPLRMFIDVNWSTAFKHLLLPRVT
ncbi:hypothetical protein DFH07DRAFT_740361 [Mycena maculata]|uniref:Uncharacterized protein n=1 Tax=Mycena maculata TaxID=230809 RepID=A0AAD7JBD4_9AGAR|nr:hypothetical protein DFH07DRAFT_740361 [Mycena maculata]